MDMPVWNDYAICSGFMATMDRLYSIKDLHTLLDAVLLQARQFTHADAGSIYLVENEVLHFSYTHNDTLFGSSGSNKYLYTSRTLAIDNSSLAGYVALTGRPLLVDDVYRISPEMPFSFNGSFDRESGYRTQSILAVPLITSTKNTVGVMEIINPLNDAREFATFSAEDRVITSSFAQNAAAAIERAMMTREIILRMVKMCELRDPLETGVHASRVGAYAAEIYHQWSLTQGIGDDEIRHTKDLLRIAAMLHDLGKVAIPDTILKKPSGLSDDEFTLMKFHTIHGARLFQNKSSDLDVLSAEVALNHHEHWDGQGYPGKIDNIFQDQVQLGAGKQGEEIPLAGRVVAVADVYDALISKRVYKEALSESQTLDYIKAQSGKHFDPQVVEAFLAIYDVIVAIGKKYREEGVPPNPVAI